MWYSIYLDGWFSFYVEVPSHGCDRLDLSHQVASGVLDPHARGPPIIFGRQ
jgi:hypothetical protein